MSVTVAFVRGLSVGVCPSVRVSISQEIKLCTPSLAAQGGIGGDWGCCCPPRLSHANRTVSSQHKLFISLIWHKWDRPCPALQEHRIRPPHPRSWAHRPPAPPVSARPGLRAQWCRWRGCGSPPPCQGLGRAGGPRAPSPGLQRAPGEGPGWAPRPGAGCRARTARGARGSS